MHTGRAHSSGSPWPYEMTVARVSGDDLAEIRRLAAHVGHHHARLMGLNLYESRSASSCCRGVSLEGFAACVAGNACFEHMGLGTMLRCCMALRQGRALQQCANTASGSRPALSPEIIEALPRYLHTLVLDSTTCVCCCRPLPCYTSQWNILSEVWAHQDLLHLAEDARSMLGVPLLCVRVVLVRTVCWPRSARSLAAGSYKNRKFLRCIRLLVISWLCTRDDWSQTSAFQVPCTYCKPAVLGNLTMQAGISRGHACSAGKSTR